MGEQGTYYRHGHQMCGGWKGSSGAKSTSALAVKITRKIVQLYRALGSPPHRTLKNLLFHNCLNQKRKL